MYTHERTEGRTVDHSISHCTLCDACESWGKNARKVYISASQRRNTHALQCSLVQGLLQCSYVVFTARYCCDASASATNRTRMPVIAASQCRVSKAVGASRTELYDGIILLVGLLHLHRSSINVVIEQRLCIQPL